MPLLPPFNPQTPTIPSIPSQILSFGGKFTSVNNFLGDFFDGITKPRIYPKDFCYIQVLESERGGEDSFIYFQQMPIRIMDSKAANYQDIPIVGRSSPYKSYSNSSSRSLQFTLSFFAQPDEVHINYTPEMIKGIADALQALTYPIYDSFTILPPPKCLVRIGNQIAMIGVCKSVNIAYDIVNPWTTGKDRNYAYGHQVSLVFEEALKIPLSYKERKAGEVEGVKPTRSLTPTSYTSVDSSSTSLEGGISDYRYTPNEADFSTETVYTGFSNEI